MKIHNVLNLTLNSDRRREKCLALFLTTMIALVMPSGREAQAAKPQPIEFNRDIRPILSDKCFFCHGPDSAHRDSDLRLDREKDAKAPRDGTPAIVPGNLEKSELVRRITTDNADEVMPKPEAHKKLTQKEIETLKRWVAEGAVWEDAWAYVSPKMHPTPTVKDAAWSKNWIDDFILKRLEAEGIKPSPDADKVTLIRRLCIDLNGLPPTPKEVDDFVNDKSPGAYEKVVDRLLASPHYGERMAIYWLDLVRYADTVGYHGDQNHHISPYRDYVINALNNNMKFDQFTREQLSGDLLPNATLDQRVATGYLRVLQTSHEGGVQVKEYLAIYAADRIRNLSNVWMGATMGCATCHDHKFDPYTMKDFYSMQSFFADVDETWQQEFGTNTSPTPRPPEIEVPTELETAKIATLEANLKAAQENLQKAAPEVKERLDEDRTVATAPRSQKKRLARELAAKRKAENNETVEEKNSAATKEDATEKPNPEQAESKPELKPNPEIPALTKKVEEAQKELDRFHATIRRTMVAVSIKPRTIRLLPRGNWMDESGGEMKPEIPEFLGKIDASDRRPSRLDLANWLTDAKNGAGGLTARVMANRFWYLLFGSGLARVLDDFGGQGEPPTHPELLDRLALEFVEHNWDMKHMMKFIVMSRAYQLSSQGREDLAEKDPLNQLYSHQSQFRFPAEVIRDSTLFVSGLLVDKIGGPSAQPYQPALYYRHLNFPEREYQFDKNENQWRRGLYMHWQRQFLHPMLKAFDAPAREECTTQRPRSNTPLAALVFLNDPTFVEASRMFAARMTREGGGTTRDKIHFAFRNAASRSADDEEQNTMSKLLEESRDYYRKNPEEAKKLLKVGLKKVEPESDKTELAAWTIVARAILSLDEATTRN